MGQYSEIKSKKSIQTKTACNAVAHLREGALGHHSPQQKTFFIEKIKKTWFGPFCVSTSWQQKFGPFMKY